VVPQIEHSLHKHSFDIVLTLSLLVCERHRSYPCYAAHALFLAHDSIDPLRPSEARATEICINIERTLFESTSDEFTVRVTDKPEEVKALLEVGFDYVCQKDNLIFVRKRK
jgi:uncharacterized CHY-type Zn-finger protein